MTAALAPAFPCHFPDGCYDILRHLRQCTRAQPLVASASLAEPGRTQVLALELMVSLCDTLLTQLLRAGRVTRSELGPLLPAVPEAKGLWDSSREGPSFRCQERLANWRRRQASWGGRPWGGAMGFKWGGDLGVGCRWLSPSR